MLKSLLKPALCAVLTLATANVVLGQDQPRRPAAGGPGAGLAQRPGGPEAILGRMMGERDLLQETVAILGELNLTPEFTLSAEQKSKLQAIRDEFRKAMEKWRDEHKEDIQKLQDQAREVMRDAAGGGAGGARETFRELRTKREELMATAPKGEEAVKQVKALLTEEQRKAVEEKIAQREKQQEEMRRNLGGGEGGRRPGAAGAGGAGAGGAERPNRARPNANN